MTTHDDYRFLHNLADGPADIEMDDRVRLREIADRLAARSPSPASGPSAERGEDVARLFEETARRFAVFAFSLDGFDSLDERDQHICREAARFALRSASPAPGEDTAPPRRRWAVEINVQADEWGDAKREIQRLAEHVGEHGPECGLTSGGYSTGGWITIAESPDMTHDRYFAELEQYLARSRAVREQEGEDTARRNQRIVDLVTAPGSQVYPSREFLTRGYVVVVDGRTGLDACERTADAAFDALFAEADGDAVEGEARSQSQIGSASATPPSSATRGAWRSSAAPSASRREEGDE